MCIKCDLETTAELFDQLSIQISKAKTDIQKFRQELNQARKSLTEQTEQGTES